jgi:2-methylcitrate dehydratase
VNHTIRDRLALLVHSVRYEDLPAFVVHETKRLILDTLGCALGGSGSEPAAIVRDVARTLGGHPEATLLGTGGRTSCVLATLVNGTLIRYLDLNDYYFGHDSAHPSGNLAAGMAVAQRTGKSGRDLLAGLVAAYELQIRFCDFVAGPGISERGWHPGTTMQFSSAALSARLLSDDPIVTANAIAISGSHNNSLAQLQRGHIPASKATAEAQICKGGVEAALLAAAGLTGPDEIFEGVAGWAKVVADGIDTEALTAPLENHFRILETCMKPYAAVAGAMAPIQAAIDLRRKDGIDAADIDSVTVRLPAVAARKAADPKKLAPKDKETADHSVHYCVAVSLLDAACGPAQFTRSRIASSDVAAMIARMRIETDDALTALWPASSGGGVSVMLHNGKEVSRLHLQPPGHPANRITDADLENKFSELADGVLSPSRIRQAIDCVWTLESCTRLDNLMELLVGDQGG